MIDYTTDYNNTFPSTPALAVQGAGRNVLILRKIESFKRADGKRGTYELEHRWLSQTCERPKDQAWACVRGQSYTYWQCVEIRALLRQKSMNLIKFFKLWS